MESTPLLREGVEEVIGMDDQVLLFDADSGVYHRVGPLAAAVVRKFDGRLTHSQIADLISADYPNSSPLDVARIDELVEGLHEKSLLAGDTAQRRKRGGLDRLLPRFLVFKKFSSVLAPAASLVRKISHPILAAITCLVAIAGYIFGISTLFSVESRVLTTPEASQLASSVLLALIIHLLGVFLHESWHGIIAGACGQPIRGLGFALMFWVIPVAYVDRTDAYRLRNRSGRVAIALAGMVSDGWVMGATAFFATSTTGLAHATSLVLLTYLLLLLIANLNPLAPSDTVAAIEAATGSIDIRGRSMAIFRATIFRTPLPSYLRNLSLHRRVLLFIYGLLSIAFAAWAICFVVYTLWSGLIQGVR